MNDARPRARALAGAALACMLAIAPARAAAQLAPPPAESSPAECSNGADDDRDGQLDCADAGCALYVFCAPARAPEPDVVHHRSLVWMQVTGVVAWATVYLVGIGITAGVGGSADEIGLSAIPLAGPWICLAGGCREPGPYAAGLITDGAVQALGLLFLIIGSAVQVEERPSRWALAPWLGPERVGAGLALSF